MFAPLPLELPGGCLFRPSGRTEAKTVDLLFSLLSFAPTNAVTHSDFYNSENHLHSWRFVLIEFPPLTEVSSVSTVTEP